MTGLNIWNRIAEQRVVQHDAAVPRNPETGIMLGAEAGDFGPEDARGAVLFIHGFGGNGNHFEQLPRLVGKSGWHARVLLLPGHGTVPAEFEKTSADQMLDASLEETRELLKHHEKVVLLGHSMGGALCALVAAREPRVAGIILGAPLFAVTPRWYYGLAPETWIGLGPSLVRWVYSNPDRQPVFRSEVRRDIISYKWFPTKAAVTAMGIARRAGDNATLAKITQPVLLLHGIRDEVTWADASVRAVEKMSSTTKRTVLLENSNHILFWDYERERIAQEVMAFLNERL